MYIVRVKVSGKLTFNFLVVTLGEVEHRPGGTLRGLTQSLPAGVLADTDQDAAVAVGELGQRLARLLLGPSALGSAPSRRPSHTLSKWTVVRDHSVDPRSN